MSNDLSDAAFPSNGNSGMTLRDYFAAKAIINLVTCEVLKSYEAMAKEAYAVADAMLIERAK